MQEIKALNTAFSPPKVLVLGFMGIILLGAGLLKLPGATVEGISFVDALFTSTSAVCVTGLIVLDTPAAFTHMGQGIILALIQIGGLGYMSAATLIALMLGKRIGISERIMIRESMNISTLEGIVRFMQLILAFVFTVELTGAALLALRFSSEMPITKALYYGLFHAVSAFNNAGFSLFSTSLMSYRGDLFVNLTIMGLIITGGMGFIVLTDIRRRRLSPISQHTSIVVSTTVALIAAGALLFWLVERQYYFTAQKMPIAEQALASAFASVTARTAGYNTIDYSMLQPSTLFLTILLMIIGASPGSTGGGIKTTTFTVAMTHLWSTIRGKRDTVLFHRRVSEALIAKSFVILTLAVIYINVMTFVIMGIEHTEFLSTLFEVSSAFGTVGLSVGDGGVRSFCATFSDTSKNLLALTMLLGRVGPLTLFMALVSQKQERFRYPEGRVMIG